MDTHTMYKNIIKLKVEGYKKSTELRVLAYAYIDQIHI